jgi:hypothetical protein
LLSVFVRFSCAASNALARGFKAVRHHGMATTDVSVAAGPRSAQRRLASVYLHGPDAHRSCITVLPETKPTFAVDGVGPESRPLPCTCQTGNMNVHTSLVSEPSHGSTARLSQMSQVTVAQLGFASRHLATTRRGHSSWHPGTLSAALCNATGARLTPVASVPVQSNSHGGAFGTQSRSRRKSVCSPACLQNHMPSNQLSVSCAPQQHRARVSVKLLARCN